MRSLLAIIALFICLTNSVYAQNYFIDKSDVNSSFMAFKIQLGKALNTHDTTALFAMLHYTIAESPEGCGLNGSKECFIEQMGFRKMPMAAKPFGNKQPSCLEWVLQNKSTYRARPEKPPIYLPHPVLKPKVLITTPTY